MPRINDQYTRSWIIENAVPLVLDSGEELTIRGLHYLLLPLGMPNTVQHYKRVVEAMGVARWDGLVPFDSFVDFEREVIGITKANETDLDSKMSEGRMQIKLWMTCYSKNRWENQPIYPEVFIEKKTQIGVFRKPCQKRSVALSPCKGYPSLTFIHEASERFLQRESEGKKCVMLYFGDHDPSGDDIPRNIGVSLDKFGCDVEIRRIALTKEQVISMDLPPAPTKRGDSRSTGWDGVGQVEMDAVPSDLMQSMLNDALDELFDFDLGDKLDEQESQETSKYVKSLKKYVAGL